MLTGKWKRLTEERSPRDIGANKVGSGKWERLRDFTIPKSPDVCLDGDWHAVYAARKDRKKQMHVLDQTENKRSQPDFYRRPNCRNVSLAIDTTSKDLRNRLFTIVTSGELDELKTLMSASGTNINLTDAQFLHKLSHENLLHWSIRNRQMHIVRYLIEECDVEILCQEYDSFSTGLSSKKNALHKLTQLGEYDMAKLLLKTVGASHLKLKLLLTETYFKVPGQRPRTLNCLHIAAFVGSEDLIGLFVDHGINVNVQNIKHDTALLWGTRWNKACAVKTLLQKGANPMIENDKGSTPLYWAVRYGHTDMVRLLLTETDVDVNHRRKVGFEVPIVLAATIGLADITKMLLEHCADPNIAILNGETALQHAAEEGHDDVVKILLKHDAILDAVDSRGDTALTFAARHAHADVVSILLSHGADVWHTNYEGKDAWSYGIDQEDNGVLKVLVNFIQNENVLDASFSEVDYQPQTTRSPICLAASIGACDKIDFILKMGISSMNYEDEDNVFLHSAAKSDQADVILRFHAEIDVNVKNIKGNTPLHIACKYGNHKAVQALLKCKAKINIDNIKGQTALHCAAKSRKIKPATVKLLIEHTIRMHNYGTLNDPDLLGNSPLHTAAMHASPNVLWEFRSLSLNVSNDESDSPFHVAVKSNNRDSLSTMLDIYENRRRDADINNDNGMNQGILHCAALAGFDDSVLRIMQYGADVAKQDNDGNTVLHCLTKAMAAEPTKSQGHMKVFNSIIKESVRWWCITNKLSYPSDNKSLFTDYKRDAVLQLTNNIYNHENLNVLTVAAKEGSPEVLENLLMMNGVTKLKSGDNIKYDITNIIPSTSAYEDLTNGGGSKRKLSCLEMLVTLKHHKKAAKMLDIAPIKHVESIYAGLCAWTFSILIVFHILYMSVFSYVGSALTFEGQGVTNQTSCNTNCVLLYVFVPLEPAIILCFVTYAICRHVFLYVRNEAPLVAVGHNENKLLIIRKFFKSYTLTVICVLYACLVTCWIAIFGRNVVIQNYVLSVSLLVGWLLTITLTRGFKGIHYFFRMLQQMIMRDVIRFLFIYFFVLLAFSLCLHVIFQSSSALSKQYPSPLTTLFVVFNVMIGMADLFGDGFDDDMLQSGYDPAFPKAIYTIYVILSTIILLNVLIAMMNDSYQDILNEHQVTWRVDSVRLGIEIERRFPVITCFFSKFNVSSEEGDATGPYQRWYISMSEVEIDACAEDHIEDEEKLDMTLERFVTNGFGKIEEKLNESLEKMQRTMELVESKLDQLEAKLNLQQNEMHK